MKFHLVAFSTLSIAVYLVWLGYNYAKGLGSAFGNLDPALGPAHVGFMLVLVGALSAASIIAALFAPYDVARILTLLPIALVFPGEGHFFHTERGRLNEHGRIQDARQLVREERREYIGQDRRWLQIRNQCLYLDEEGRSALDNYRIRFDPNHDHGDCHLEKYEL